MAYLFLISTVVPAGASTMGTTAGPTASTWSGVHLGRKPLYLGAMLARVGPNDYGRNTFWDVLCLCVVSWVVFDFTYLIG